MIHPGESSSVFDDIDGNPALAARADERQIFIREMRGPAFTETVPEGRREWHLVGANAVLIPAKYGWALIPGFALLIGGLGCFFISWRRP